MTRKSIAIIFDTETCDRPPNRNDFVQLSSVMFVEGDTATAAVFDELAKPNIPITQGAYEVHGIGEDQVADKDPSSAVAEKWWNYVTEFAQKHRGDVYLVGHNIVRFDVPLVAQHLSEWPNVKMIDTLWAARRLDPTAPNHQLSQLVGKRYGLDVELPERAHDGLADCWMAGLLLNHYLTMTGKDIATFAEWLATPQILKTVPFGKYKGMPFSTLRPYSLKWFTQADMDPDIRFTALQLLGSHG